MVGSAPLGDVMKKISGFLGELQVGEASINVDAIPNFVTNVIESTSEPFEKSEYKFLCFVNDYGIFVVQKKKTLEVLYVGEAHGQTLRKRISQNYADNNSGGIFRANWCSKEGKNFDEFKEFLSDCVITTFSVEEKSKNLICALESMMIYLLRPTYNTPS